ncbi:mulatexin-like [Humulus lupulus]|uniref:mulatexin-like n=1 Tax=Humulus lupulus TaxID=3486 RepID=UPI002B4030CF|nr:mulatexin-like [Humulus lupulus]
MVMLDLINSQLIMVILVIVGETNTVGWPEFVSADYPRCGKVARGALCPNNLCCSILSLCGSTLLHCTIGCQSPPPSPPPPSPPPPSPERPDSRCGPDFGNTPCNTERCCSRFWFCGSTTDFCQGSNCRSQCGKSARRGLHEDDNSVDATSNIINETLFNKMFKHRKDCPSQDFYNYNSFIIATASFPSFGTTGDVATRKRELAAFFAQTSQATTREQTDSTDPYAWGYCYVNRTTTENYYCTSSQWSCASGKYYYSRGPIQLTHNYNYGLAGDALGIDLINNPDLVATDPIVSFQTAIWFWMTQHDNKHSFHNIITNENSEPNELPNYNNFNDGLRHQSDFCIGTNIVGFYKRFCDMLEVSYGVFGTSI